MVYSKHYPDMMETEDWQEFIRVIEVLELDFFPRNEIHLSFLCDSSIDASSMWYTYEGSSLIRIQEGICLGSMNVELDAKFTQLKPVVILSGTAKEGKAGPPLGLVDIGVSESAYLFRVALPGVRRSQCNVKCDLQIDGRVCIAGVVTGSEVIKNSSTAYEMKIQQLCPPGPFSISFNLPGPVDTRLASHNFRPDGILEVVVMKYRIPIVAVDGSWLPPS